MQDFSYIKNELGYPEAYDDDLKFALHPFRSTSEMECQ